MFRFVRSWLRSPTPCATARSSRRTNCLRLGLECLERRELLTISTAVADPLQPFDNIIYVESTAGFPKTPGFEIGVGNPANASNPALYEHMLVTGFHDNFYDGFIVIRGADNTHDISHDFGEEVDLLPHTPQTLLWTGTGSNADWSDPSNWFVEGSGQVGEPGIAPQSGDSLIFDTSAVKSTTNDLSGLSLNSITFKQPGYTISGNGITLTGSINDSATAGSPPVNDVVALSNITLSGTDQINVTGNLPLTVQSSLLGTGSLGISAGTSEVLLDEGANYSGGTNLKSGTLQIAGSNSLGTGKLTVEQGTLSDGTIAALTLDNLLSLDGSVSFNLGGLLQFSHGASLKAASTVTVVAGTLEFDGTLSGTGTLTLDAAPQTSSTSTGFIVDANDSLKLNAQNSSTSNVPLTLEGTLTSAAAVTAGANLSVYLGHQSTDAAGTGAGLTGGGAITATQDNISTGPALSSFNGTITLKNCTTTIAGASTDSALGFGPLELNGGTLNLPGTSTVLRNAVTLNGSSYAVSFGAAGDLELTGTVNVATASTLNVQTGTTKQSQLEFFGNVHGSQLSLKQTLGDIFANVQGGLANHLLDYAYYLNVAGPLTGTLDVESKAYAVLASADAGPATLSGGGAINVMGTLESQTSQSQYSGKITVKTGGEADIASDVADVLGTGALVLDGGSLGCTDPTNTVTLDNDVTLAGDISLLNFDGLTFTGTITVLPGNTLVLDAGTLEFEGEIAGTSSLLLDEEPASGATSTDIILDGNDQIGIEYGPAQSSAKSNLSAQSEPQATAATPSRLITIEKDVGPQTVDAGYIVTLGGNDGLVGSSALQFTSDTIVNNKTLSYSGAMTFNNCTGQIQTSNSGIIQSPLGSGTLTFDGGAYSIGGVQTIFGNKVSLTGSQMRITTAVQNADLQFTNEVDVGSGTLYLANLNTAPSQIEFKGTLFGESLTLEQYSGGPVLVNVQCSTEAVHLIDKAAFVNIGRNLTGKLDVESGAQAGLNAADYLGVKFDTAGTLDGSGAINVSGTLHSDSDEADFGGAITLAAGGQIIVGASTVEDFLGAGKLILNGGTISCDSASKSVDTFHNPLTLSGSVTIKGFYGLTFDQSVTVSSNSTIYLKGGTLKLASSTFSGSGKVKFIGSGVVEVQGEGGKLPTQIDVADSTITPKLI